MFFAAYDFTTIKSGSVENNLICAKTLYLNFEIILANLLCYCLYNGILLVFMFIEKFAGRSL